MTQAGIKSSSGLRRLVDEFSSTGIASLPILLDVLKYPDHEVRGAAALGVLGPLSVDVVVVLCQALDDEDCHVREFAAMVLDQYAHKQQLIARAS